MTSTTTHPCITLWSIAGDLYVWDGGTQIAVYEEAAPWQAGEQPDITIRIPDTHPFTPDGFTSLLAAHALLWEPSAHDDGHQIAASRQRVAADADSACYSLGRADDGDYSLMLFQFGEDRRNEVKIFGMFPGRMDALAVAQHWETTGQLKPDNT